MADGVFDQVAGSSSNDDSFGYLADTRSLSTFSSDGASSFEAPYEAPASATAAVVKSVTGKFSDISQKYHVDFDSSAVIGSGYQGAVRECVDRSTGRRYAVKSVDKRRRAAKLTDLHREVQLLREIGHDRVLRLVDLREDASFLHVVTDLYGGGDLLSRIERAERKKKSSPGGDGCLAEETAARISSQILSGISYLHSKHIVHRDLKPENVVFESMEEDSPIRIVDFGLARKHYRDSFEPYMSAVVGSFHFVSPEVLGQKYDKACDLWSVGAIAFMMLCGRPPFDGATGKEVRDAVRRGKFTFETNHWKGPSKEAKDFVRRLLRSSPKKRMTAEDALEHPWLARHGVGTSDQENRRGGDSLAKAKSERLQKRGPVLGERISSIGRGRSFGRSLSMLRL